MCAVEISHWSTNLALLERVPGRKTSLPYTSFNLVKPTEAMRLLNLTAHISAVVLDTIKKQTLRPQSATKKFAIDHNATPQTPNYR